MHARAVLARPQACHLGGKAQNWRIIGSGNEHPERGLDDNGRLAWCTPKSFRGPNPCTRALRTNKRDCMLRRR